MASTEVVDEPLPPPPVFPHERIVRGHSHGSGNILGGMWRPAQGKATAAAAAAALAPGTGSSRGGARRSASEGRLRTASSAAGSTHSRLSTGASDRVYKPLVPFSRRDHIANLLNHPLPVHKDYGDGELESGKLRSLQEGPFPTVPGHIAVVLSQNHAIHSYDDEFREVSHGQRKTEQWCGFPRDFYSEYTEQVVKQGHIMRGQKQKKHD